MQLFRLHNKSHTVYYGSPITDAKTQAITRKYMNQDSWDWPWQLFNIDCGYARCSLNKELNIGFVTTVWFEGSENCFLVTAFKADSLE